MAVPQFLDQLPHRANLVRVQPDGRFVQDNQFRLMHQGVGQADPLAVSFGKMADDPLADLAQAALGDDRIDPFARTAVAQPFEPRPKFQVFPHPHVVVQRIVLRHVANTAAHLVGLRKNIQSRHPGRAGGRRHEAGKDAHGGAFARAVIA